jgi:DNA-binding CsgD family transcriptional regulator
MPVSWPLVGRREELAFVEEALGQKESRGVILAGAAGVGKSRLASETLGLAESRGFASSWAIGTRAAAHIPFGALAHLLPEDIPSSSDRGNVLRTAADAILGSSDTGRFVFGVDDAHLLDHQSVALLHHLTLARRAFLVLTVRSGEPVPEGLVGLWKDELTEWLEVQPLSREDTNELVGAALGAQVEERTTLQLWELTLGNPLFLRELVVGALEDRSLMAKDGLWRWRDPAVVSRRLPGVLTARLDGLTPEERELMEVVSLGDPLEVGIVETLAASGSVERLELRGLLEEARQARRVKVRPSHPLYGEILRTEVTPARARSIHRSMALALEATGARRSEDLLRLATWHLEARSPVQPGLFLEAAQRAVDLFDYSLAERLARAVVETEGGAHAAHLLAMALIRQGKFDKADELLARITTDAADSGLRVQVARDRANNLHWNLLRTDDALAVLTAATHVVEDAALEASLDAARSSLLLGAGRLAEAHQASMRVMHRPSSSDQALGEAARAAGVALIYTGQPQEGLDLHDRYLDQLLQARHQWAFGTEALSTYRTLGHLFAGTLIEGAALAEQDQTEVAESGIDWVLGWIGGLVGVVLAAQGRVKTATRFLKEAVVLLGETNIPGNLQAFQSNLAYSLAIAGDISGAERVLQQGEATQPHSLGVLEGWIALPRVWVPACRGETSTAINIARDEANRLSSMGFRSQQAIALHDAVRLGAPELVADELAVLASACDGLLIPALARHAVALAEGNALASEEIADDFETMGAYLLAAEAAAEASRLYRDAGAKKAADRTATRSKNLADKCEGPRTPALALVEEPLPLTRREKEIATLAAHGHSNTEIADRLVLSTRTVENHLHRAFTKLGVESRGELSAVLSVGRRSVDA